MEPNSRKTWELVHQGLLFRAQVNLQASLLQGPYPANEAAQPAIIRLFSRYPKMKKHLFRQWPCKWFSHWAPLHHYHHYLPIKFRKHVRLSTQSLLSQAPGQQLCVRWTLISEMTRDVFQWTREAHSSRARCFIRPTGHQTDPAKQQDKLRTS